MAILWPCAKCPQILMYILIITQFILILQETQEGLIISCGGDVIMRVLGIIISCIMIIYDCDLIRARGDLRIIITLNIYDEGKKNL